MCGVAVRVCCRCLESGCHIPRSVSSGEQIRRVVAFGGTDWYGHFRSGMPREISSDMGGVPNGEHRLGTVSFNDTGVGLCAFACVEVMYGGSPSGERGLCMTLYDVFVWSFCVDGVQCRHSRIDMM